MSDSRKRKRRRKPALMSAPPDSVGVIQRPSKQPTSLLDPAAITLKQQRWTELTAVGQILADEIVHYQREHHSTLSQGEARQLRSWSNGVQNRIYQRTTCVLENVALATEMRQKQREVELTRDDLMVLRTQTKKIRDETLRFIEDAEKADKEASTMHSASLFLTALATLAENASSEK
jgi:uncharacterized phage infection (PIP) family protein YhgE